MSRRIVVSSSILAEKCAKARAAVAELADADLRCERRWDSTGVGIVARRSGGPKDEAITLHRTTPIRTVPRATLSWTIMGVTHSLISFPCPMDVVPHDPDLRATHGDLLLHLRSVVASLVPLLAEDAAFGNTVSALAEGTRDLMATASACAVASGRYGPSSSATPAMRMAFPSPWAPTELLNAFDSPLDGMPEWIDDVLTAKAEPLPHFASRTSGGGNAVFDVIIQPYTSPLPPMSVVEAMRRIGRTDR